MKKIEIEIKGRRAVGAVAKVGTTTWYSLGGEVWTTEEESSRSTRNRSKATVLDATRVNAPMPGKIIKVLTAVDASVNAGDVLIVMEAMKMEYTLKAGASGVVESILCSAGQQVTLGSTLVKMKVSAKAAT